MPSSISSFERQTASDRPGVAQPVPVRPVPVQRSAALLLVSICMAVLLLGSWELYWRNFGAVPGYRDDDSLWGIQRRRLDHGEGDATVLIGASRTFFDVQLPVWQRLSGRAPLQLSVDGTSPAFALDDLADDPKFTGKVVMGIAPDVFFTANEYHANLVRFTATESPGSKVSKWLSMNLVEPYAAFYDPDFALFKVWRRQPWWPVRPGKPVYLQIRKLQVTGADRNNRMWRKVETDPGYAALARSIWAEDFEDPSSDPAQIKEAEELRDSQIERVAKAIAKLQARGIPVILVREPSAGAYRAYEERAFPRVSTWDVLVRRLRVPAIHFEDYPELQNLDLPDGSHLSGASADRYTEALYRIIDRQIGAPRGAHW